MRRDDMRPTDDAARVPPHSQEAEQSVLGALLLDNRALESVGDMLQPADFYVGLHGAIYGAIQSLINAGKPADVVTVCEAGALDLVYLNELAGCVPSASNARAYARIVRELSVRRMVARRARELHDAAMRAGDDGEKPVADVVDGAVTDFLALMQGREVREPVEIGEALVQLIDQVQAMSEGQSGAITTGLVDLDNATSGGGRPGELWVIGARPSMGKSAITLTIALAVAEVGWCLVLTQEDSLSTMASRVVANLGRVNLADLRNPQRARDPDALWSGLADGVDAGRARRMLVDDQGGLTLADVRRKVQQAKRRTGGKLQMVAIDYLQLMQGDNDNRNQMLGEISNGLKALAKQLGVWVVLLSQLSRKADERVGVPQMSDLRDSGDIEGAADTILLLHREAQKRPTEDNKHWAQAHICKQKNGPTCTVDLFFDGAHQRFAAWSGPVPRVGLKRSGETSGGLR